METESTSQHRAIFTIAADLLDCPGMADAPPAALDLLAQLDATDATPASHADLARLLRAAAGFGRVFTLSSRHAPGMFAVGAEVRAGAVGDASSFGVSGTGLSLREALAGCVGEGVELLSQFPAVGEDGVSLPLETALAAAPSGMPELWDLLAPYRRDRTSTTLSWTEARRIIDGTAVLVPTDLCLRRPPERREIAAPWPLGTGCGAGVDAAAAACHGLLELVERDAVAHWWQGARPPRMLAAGTGAMALAGNVLAQLRGDSTQRTTWLLDIGSEIAIPVVAAVACDPDGFGACFGFAARPSLAAAARSALLELGQMELAHEIVTAKRAERGEAAWNATDRRHARRYTELDTARCAALRPLPPAAGDSDLPASDAATELAELARRLIVAGLDPCVIDLTRPEFGIAVVRVICPGLQPHPDAPAVPRLAAARLRCATAPDCYSDIPLL